MTYAPSGVGQREMSALIKRQSFVPNSSHSIGVHVIFNSGGYLGDGRLVGHTRCNLHGKIEITSDVVTMIIDVSIIITQAEDVTIVIIIVRNILLSLY